MFLAVDVGNTNITVGVFQGARLKDQWRLPSAPGLGGRICARARRWGISGAAVASVVPGLDAGLARALKGGLGCRILWITPRTKLGMRLLVDRPGEVGADRIVNAVAAARLYGAPAVIVDFGTATTFDCISRRGDYLGGAILPGPHLAARALADYTAKLPLVPVSRPRRVVGRNTVECIQGGLYYGYLGMIEKVLRLTLAEMKEPRASVLATGGLSALFKTELGPRFRLVPDLTLQGIRLAFDRAEGAC